MVSRSYTWVDDNATHSDQDQARAAALAKKWSSLQSQREEKVFRRLSDLENGSYFNPYEDCECQYCLKANHSCDEEGPDGGCQYCAIATDLTECEAEKSDNLRREEERAEVDIELELIEDKLRLLGARIMRPYEHWNEDESYMQYMEQDRFGGCDV